MNNLTKLSVYMLILIHAMDISASQKPINKDKSVPIKNYVQECSCKDDVNVCLHRLEKKVEELEIRLNNLKKHLYDNIEEFTALTEPEK